MERGNVIVIAIVVAAVALFAMRFFSDSPEDVQLAALSATDRAGRLGSGSGEYGTGSDGRGGSALGGASGGIGGSARSGSHAGGPGGAGGAGGFAGRGGSASAFGGGARGGGSVGSSGSGAGGRSGTGATVADIAGAARVAPKAERQANLVESLGSRPPTKSDLERPVQPDLGEDVALKVDSTQDIAEGGGQAVGGEVKDAENGDDGIKVEGDARVEFPNAGNASKEGSISFTLKPEWAGADASDNALVQIRQEHEWNNRLEIVKNGEFLRAILTDNTGKEADISFRITDWQPGEEKTINFSWGNDESGQGRTELSIDNQVVGRNQYPGQLEFSPNTPMIFGGDHPGSTYRPAQATIGNFVVGKAPIFTH